MDEGSVISEEDASSFFMRNKQGIFMKTCKKKGRERK